MFGIPIKSSKLNGFSESTTNQNTSNKKSNEEIGCDWFSVEAEDKANIIK